MLGYFRGEPVYSRENIHDLFSRKQWMEFHNREVFDNEQPIKIKRRKLTRSDGPIQREKIPIPSSSPYGSVNI